VVVAVTALAACEPYRIEYRPRPAFAHAASNDQLPEEASAADGSRIVYRTSRARGALQETSESDEKPFMIREESEDGQVTLRAILPEHVLINTMTCLRGQEYQLLWDQLLAEGTKAAYESEGGYEAFAGFFERHRIDLGRTLNRMIVGLPRNEVVVDNLGYGAIRLRFHPIVGRQFKFTSVTMVSEEGGLRLAMIE
jgi:hypothetical protein